MGLQVKQISLAELFLRVMYITVRVHDYAQIIIDQMNAGCTWRHFNNNLMVSLQQWRDSYPDTSGIPVAWRNRINNYAANVLRDDTLVFTTEYVTYLAALDSALSDTIGNGRIPTDTVNPLDADVIAFIAKLEAVKTAAN